MASTCWNAVCSHAGRRVRRIGQPARPPLAASHLGRLRAELGLTHPDDVEPDLELDLAPPLADAPRRDALTRPRGRLEDLEGRPDVERAAAVRPELGTLVEERLRLEMRTKETYTTCQTRLGRSCIDWGCRQLGDQG